MHCRWAGNAQEDYRRLWARQHLDSGTVRRDPLNEEEANLGVELTSTLLLGCVARGQEEQRPSPVHFTILEVTIGKSDFAGLQKALGPAKLCEWEEEHTAVARYEFGGEELLFEFSDVGGGTVTAFYFGPPGQMGPPCAASALTRTTKTLSTSGGVHLGMKDDEFVKFFGRPEKKTKQGQWEYYWEWKEEMTDEQKARYAKDRPGKAIPAVSVAVTIQATFSNGALRSFYVSKLEVL